MPGEDEIDPCGAVPMNAKAADLGQEFARRPILRQSNGSPGTGRIISGEDTGCPVRSQVEASSNDTARGSIRPDQSVAKSTSANAPTARSRQRPLGSRSSKA